MGNKLRVAMISFHTNPLEQPGVGNAGGMNVYVAQLAYALADLGVEVELFTRANSAAGSKRIIVEKQVRPGVRLWEIPTETLGQLAIRDLADEVESFTAGVLHVINSQSAALGLAPAENWVDLIHSHYWLSGLSGLELKSKLHIPLVHSMHTMARTKNAALAPGDIPESIQRIIGETDIVESADALIAATAHEANELSNEYDADPSKIAIIPPGVDKKTFTPAITSTITPSSPILPSSSHPAELSTAIPQGPRECGSRSESAGSLKANNESSKLNYRNGLAIPAPLKSGKIILFAGRIQKLKNPDLLVRALPALPADTHLVILGGVSGDSLGEKELKALAAELNVADRVQILAPVPARELANWYRAADLVAVPSYNETYGLVAAEAISSGTPVVAAAVGGLPTIVQDGVTGKLVPGHSLADWTRALNELLSDDELRAKLAQNCTAATNIASWQEVASQTAKIYKNLTSTG